MTIDSAVDSFELSLYGRRSKVKRLTLSQKKAQLWRIVKKTPEVIVKVSGGGKTAKHVKAHLDYITRHGRLEGITDQEEIVHGKKEVRELLDYWDLDIMKNKGKCRQAFNIVLSMPENTRADKVLQAAQNFSRDTFFGEHQYVMVLHEDRAHPHVHLVVKAENNKGKRLHIRKATLQEWRETFAEKMREQGIEANATPRRVRGNTRKAKKSAIYFAEKRGHSNVLKNKLLEVKEEIATGKTTAKPWEDRIIKSRQAVIESLLTAAKEMKQQGDVELAAHIVKFAQGLPKPETERHKIKKQLSKIIKETRSPAIKNPADPKKERDIDK